MASERPPATAPDQGTGASARPQSLLVIDNDASLVEFLAFYFEDKGFAVHTALDGRRGVELARIHRPSVIVTDLMMDELHGLQVVQAVRAEPGLADTIVIVMSAKTFKTDIDRTRELGADGYLVKPFKTEELHVLIERLMAARSSP
jgi:DNA-binding response OmpR family regulator